MSQSKRQFADVPHVLASDLDGTLIPLPGDAANEEDLATLATALKRRGIPVLFATGRHFDSAFSAIAEHGLPVPDIIVCDVGSSIYEATSGGQYHPIEAFADHLRGITDGAEPAGLAPLAESIEHLVLQEPEHQQRFKLSCYTHSFKESLLHEAEHALSDAIAERGLPFTVIASIDHSKGGMIDVLPRGVSKCHALEWLVDYLDLPRDGVVFAGDSGNDYAALTGGFEAILVGNAAPSLRERVTLYHREQGTENLLYQASGTASSAVLEGCRHFGLVD